MKPNMNDQILDGIIVIDLEIHEGFEAEIFLTRRLETFMLFFVSDHEFN